MKYRPTSRLYRQLRSLARLVEEYGVRGGIVEFFRFAFRSLRRRGIIGFFKNTSQEASSQKEAEPQQIQPFDFDLLLSQQIHPFDLLHGTNTGGLIEGGRLSSISLSGLYSTSYAPILPSVLIQAISALPVQYKDFNFVDLGCGKGRALLVAAQFPFRHLTGVELASELCDIAKANVATNPDWIARISIANQDAIKVVFPDGPLLIYFYHPFLPPVLRRVLKNLERQLRSSPRPTYILYGNNQKSNPRFTDVLNSFPSLREISHKEYPFSPEDASYDMWHRSQESVTAYCIDLTFK